MRTCDEILDLISLRLDGELTPEQALELEEHLATCPACRALADDLAGICSVMPGMNVEPPASIMENVMERIKGEGAKVVPFPAKKNSTRQWKAWGGIAAALVLVVGGAFVLWGGNDTTGGAPMTLDAGIPEETASAYKAAIDGAENEEKAISLPTPEPSAVPNNAPAEAPKLTDEPAAQTYGGRGEDQADNKSDAPATTASPATGTVPPQPRAFMMPLPTPSAEPSAAAEPSTAPTPMPDNRQQMTGLQITTAAKQLTPAEAAKKLYEEKFAETHPDAEYIDDGERIQYVLEAMHPVNDGEPDGQSVSTVLDYRYLSENQKYYVFLVENVFIDSQETGETRGSHLQFIAYPSAGEGETLCEPMISDYSEGQQSVSEDYDKAKADFWEKVNK